MSVAPVSNQATVAPKAAPSADLNFGDLWAHLYLTLHTALNNVTNAARIEAKASNCNNSAQVSILNSEKRMSFPTIPSAHIKTETIRTPNRPGRSKWVTFGGGEGTWVRTASHAGKVIGHNTIITNQALINLAEDKIQDIQNDQNLLQGQYQVLSQTSNIIYTALNGDMDQGNTIATEAAQLNTIMKNIAAQLHNM